MDSRPSTLARDAPIARRLIFGTRIVDDKYAVDPRALGGTGGGANAEPCACCILARQGSEAALPFLQHLLDRKLLLLAP